MDLIREYWITVKDHPRYEVSNLGRVRNKKTRRILSQFYSGRGDYLMVTMDGVKRYVHKIVLSSFVEEPEKGMIVIHEDRNNDNNNLANLSWAYKKAEGRPNKVCDDRVKVVRCRECRNRYNCNFARDDGFFCADGRR